MNKWLAKLICGGTFRFRPHEQKVLDLVLSKLTDRSRRALSEQVRSTEFIQRTINDRFVRCFYKQDCSAEISFAHSPKKITLARIDFRSKDIMGMRCDVTLICGCLNSLEFSKPPKLLNETSFNDISITLHEETAWLPDSPADEIKVGPILAALGGVARLTDVLLPAAKDEVTEFKERSSTVFPGDLTKLLAECDGFKCQNWTFNGTRSAQTPTPEDDIVRIANSESEPLLLCLKVDAKRPEVYLYQEEDEEFTPYGSSFVEAFLRAVTESEPTVVAPTSAEAKGVWPPPVEDDLDE
jgi:hypothetical protein